MMTILQVMEQLTGNGFLSADQQAEMTATLDAYDNDVEKHAPWYIRALMGLSAWIAALLLLTFLMGALLDGGISALIVGLLFCGVAVPLRWRASRSASDSTFTEQLALALSLAGQLLFLIGVADLTNSTQATVLAAIMLEIALIALYPDLLHRFLSTLVIIGALTVLLWDLEILEVVHGLIILLAAEMLWIWERQAQWVTGKVEMYSRPIGYGLAVGLLGLLSISLLAVGEVRFWWISAFGLLLVLLIQEYWILIYYGVEVPSAFPVALFCGSTLLLVPAFQTPGILGGLIVLLLGFRHGNRLLMGLAILFLIFFIIGFYYNLEISLLNKSFILMGTGLLILMFRYVLLRGLSLEEVGS
ncbi:MAG: DUF4401 domain-containing protein [Ardenticatenaceae bacterium]